MKGSFRSVKAPQGKITSISLNSSVKIKPYPTFNGSVPSPVTTNLGERRSSAPTSWSSPGNQTSANPRSSLPEPSWKKNESYTRSVPSVPVAKPKISPSTQSWKPVQTSLNESKSRSASVGSPSQSSTSSSISGQTSSQSNMTWTLSSPQVKRKTIHPIKAPQAPTPSVRPQPPTPMSTSQKISTPTWKPQPPTPVSTYQTPTKAPTYQNGSSQAETINSFTAEQEPQKNTIVKNRSFNELKIDSPNSIRKPFPSENGTNKPEILLRTPDETSSFSFQWDTENISHATGQCGIEESHSDVTRSDRQPDVIVDLKATNQVDLNKASCATPVRDRNFQDKIQIPRILVRNHS